MNNMRNMKNVEKKQSKTKAMESGLIQIDSNGVFTKFDSLHLQKIVLDELEYVIKEHLNRCQTDDDYISVQIFIFEDCPFEMHTVFEGNEYDLCVDRDCIGFADFVYLTKIVKDRDFIVDDDEPDKANNIF